MIKAVLTDLDGVVRKWDPEIIQQAEVIITRRSMDSSANWKVTFCRDETPAR